jgi:hypothetical protein
MNHSEELLKRLPNDIGGQPGAPIQRSEHQYLPWEKRCHALADILDMRGKSDATPWRISSTCGKLSTRRKSAAESSLWAPR